MELEGSKAQLSSCAFCLSSPPIFFYVEEKYFTLFSCQRFHASSQNRYLCLQSGKTWEHQALLLMIFIPEFFKAEKNHLIFVPLTSCQHERNPCFQVTIWLSSPTIWEKLGMRMAGSAAYTHISTKQKEPV